VFLGLRKANGDSTSLPPAQLCAFIIRGVVSSYYLKQMAQAAILRLDGISERGLALTPQAPA
jgi:hypothetical protein